MLTWLAVCRNNIAVPLWVCSRVLLKCKRNCNSPCHVSAPTDAPILGATTAPCPVPWHTGIMNGLANEGLLIDYGENRVLLTMRVRLQRVPRHFVNALFSPSAQPTGSLHRPTDQHWHHTWDEVYYLCNISLSPHVFFFFKSTNVLPSLCVHPFALILKMSVLYILLRGVHRAKPGVSLSYGGLNGDFYGLALRVVAHWSAQKLLRWEGCAEDHCLWLTN